MLGLRSGFGLGLGQKITSDKTDLLTRKVDCHCCTDCVHGECYGVLDVFNADVSVSANIIDNTFGHDFPLAPIHVHPTPTVHSSTYAYNIIAHRQPTTFGVIRYFVMLQSHTYICAENSRLI